ncbi:MAG: PKD domain-containing protein [Ignavibacteriae bacterium]|nr:PKD domain-containing protein [Ignavibacteriota bacterium]
MLAFKQAGGVATISNIEKDIWEKIYHGDSLLENVIQINASRTAFATATKNRITLWKIPADLQAANLTADFSLQKDTITIGDTIVFSNRTYPFKRGNIYFWNFGDGSEKSREIHPSHIFKVPGTYSVTLEVWDTLGRISAIAKKVVVNNLRVPPIAIWVHRSNSHTINSVQFSQDGNLLVSGSNGGSAKLLNTAKGDLFATLNTSGPVFSALFMKDGKSIAITQSLYVKQEDGLFSNPNYYLDHYFNYFYKWNFIDNNSTQEYSFEPALVGNIEGHDKSISIINYSTVSDLSDDNVTFLCGDQIVLEWYISYSSYGFNTRGNIIYYNLNTKKTRSLLPSFPSFSLAEPVFAPVYALRVCPNNKDYTVIIGQTSDYSHNRTLLLKNISTDSIYRQFSTDATSMHFSPDKYHLLTNTGLWDLYGNVLVTPLTLPSIFEYHPDGIHIFAVMPDSTIGIFNLLTNSYEYFYPKQLSTFTALAVSADGRHIATGSKDGYITLWDIPVLLKPSIKANFNTTLFNRSNLKTTDTIAFINTTLPANNSFDYLWDFGDGNTSAERNPHHIYIKAGTYTVKLSAWQGGKVLDKISKQQYISIIGTLGTDEPKTGESQPTFSVIPNPSYGETTLSYTLSKLSNIQIRITDVLGREVSSWSLNEQAGEHSLPWNSAIEAGMYYCTFSIGGINKTLPFVVLR